MKLSLIIGGSLLLLIIVVALFSGDDAVKPVGNVTNEEKAVQDEPKAEQKPGKADFDQVQSGMTIEQVQKILGPGTMDAESESGDIKIQMFSWQAQGELGANISVSFTNGKSDSKAQYGLK
jgi:hypothetical protein